MLNKQNERREWAREGGGGDGFKLSYLKGGGGYKCKPSSRNLREIKIWLWG